MRIITREDINQLKLQRKKKLRKLWITSILACGVVAGVVAGLVINHRSSNPKTDETMKIGNDNNSESKLPDDVATTTDVHIDIDYIDDDTSTGTDAENASFGDAPYDYYDRYVESAVDEDFVYDVPENSLPDVNGVVGENWVDDSVFEKNSSEPIPLNYFNDAVFVGDSRTEGLLLYSNLGNINGICYKGLNVGVLDSEKCILMPGQKEKVTCFDAISQNKYNYYYCMFGVNELGWVEVDSFIECFEDLIDHIYSVNPNAIVYVENVMPVTRKLSEENDVFKLERIKEYNERLLEMCQDRKDVVYLDVFSSVADEEGYLPDDASPDGVHCGMSYCMRVIQYIRMNTYSKIKN